MNAQHCISGPLNESVNKRRAKRAKHNIVSKQDLLVTKVYNTPQMDGDSPKGERGPADNFYYFFHSV